jgi:hypothetical protein
MEGIAGGYGAGGYGTPGMAYDPSMGDPKYYRFDPVRRRIRQQLYCVQLGLTGGEDLGKKSTTAKAPPAGATPAAGAAKAEPRGMWMVAKVGSPEKKYVENVYDGVRKLAEIIESKAIDLPQLDKDLRKEMKNLETMIGKKLIPAGSEPPPAAVVTDDVPGAVAPPAGKAATPAGKAPPPAGKAAAPAPPGKSVPMPPAGAPRPGPMPPAKASAAVSK